MARLCVLGRVVGVCLPVMGSLVLGSFLSYAGNCNILRPPNPGLSREAAGHLRKAGREVLILHRLGGFPKTKTWGTNAERFLQSPPSGTVSQPAQACYPHIPHTQLLTPTSA